MCNLHKNTHFWLGRSDSNTRMTESESVALPLGDAPMRILFYQIAINLSSDFTGDNKKIFIKRKNLTTCQTIILRKGG